jgi:hypothetical protein
MAVQLPEGFYRKALPANADSNSGNKSSDVNGRAPTRQEVPNVLSGSVPTMAAVPRLRSPRQPSKQSKNIAHYVGPDHKVPCVVRINERRLQNVRITDLVATDSTLHVHLRCASISFERAALGSLTTERIERCQLLISGLRHDAQFKAGTRRRPDFRLYDLAAGLCVRYGEQDLLKQVIELAQSAERARVDDQFVVAELRKRYQKWMNSSNAWHGYWTSQTIIPWNQSRIGPIIAAT